MRVARIAQAGGPEAIEVVEVPTPQPGPKQVRVRVEAAGVNFIDVYHRTGLYPQPLPATLGLEGAGTVEATGAGSALRVGQRVAWSRVPGSYATHVIAGDDALVSVPDGVDAQHAAAAMLQGMTAHYLTRSTYPLGPGDVALVHAAAGGVGLLLCQMGRAAGARIIGTTSSAEKAELARAAGASEIIDYKTQDFAAEVKRMTSNIGASVVYDSVAKDTFAGSLGCLRPRGMLVLFGQSSGPIAAFDPKLLQAGSLFLTRPSLHHYTATRKELEQRAGDVLGAVKAGALELRIHAAIPLDRAGEAHRLLESRQTSGKLLLVP